MLTENAKLLINLAISEDIGDGDHTSLSTIPKDAIGKAKLLVKGSSFINFKADSLQYLHGKIKGKVLNNSFFLDKYPFSNVIKCRSSHPDGPQNFVSIIYFREIK